MAKTIPAEEKELIVSEEKPKAVVKADKPDTAKAGKRSSKSLKETEEKVAKAERKESNEAPKAKPSIKPARSKLERRSKNYRSSAELIDRSKRYELKEAIELVKKTSKVKFDSSVEMHINLAVDPKQSDQNVRDNLVLPNGLGKTITVAVISEDEKAAKDAGADIFSSEDIFKQLEKGQINYDVLVATPAQMPKLGKYARVLGPRGLMPNPKSGTVTNDIKKAVSEAKAGKVEYRVDSTGIVHLAVGKVSFDQTAIEQNIQSVITSIKQNKPQSVKGAYIKSLFLSSTMGPSVKIDSASLT